MQIKYPNFDYSNPKSIDSLSAFRISLISQLKKQ